MDFTKCNVTKEESDKTSEYLKPATYAKGVEQVKSSIYERFIKGKEAEFGKGKEEGVEEE